MTVRWLDDRLPSFMLSVVSSSGNQRQGAACAARHCISRCVRRAYLCGVDATSGQDFSHRRQWVVDRLEAAADAFALVGYWVLGGCCERNVQLCD